MVPLFRMAHLAFVALLYSPARWFASVLSSDMAHSASMVLFPETARLLSALLVQQVLDETGRCRFFLNKSFDSASLHDSVSPPAPDSATGRDHAETALPAIKEN